MPYPFTSNQPFQYRNSHIYFSKFTFLYLKCQDQLLTMTKYLSVVSQLHNHPWYTALGCWDWASKDWIPKTPLSPDFFLGWPNGSHGEMCQIGRTDFLGEETSFSVPVGFTSTKSESRLSPYLLWTFSVLDFLRTLRWTSNERGPSSEVLVQIVLRSALK